MIAIAGMSFLYSPPRAPLVIAFIQFARRFISFSYLVCYWGVVGLHEGFQILKGSQEKELQVSILESQLSESQLQALKVQLNPHFLFNALNTLSALIHSDPAKADRMLIRLSHFLRISLEKTREESTTLGQEISVLEDYLDIERVRFGDQLQFSIEVPECLREALIPAFILQPLLENAIKHGIAGRPTGGRIHLRASQEDRVLVLEVRDNGLGLHGGDEPAKGTNIGLRITRSRLERHYGPEQSFSLQFPQAGGAVARISLPLQFDSESPLDQKRLPSGPPLGPLQTGCPE
jgi:LytS/YehU family sensor histidine kinase